MSFAPRARLATSVSFRLFNFIALHNRNSIISAFKGILQKRIEDLSGIRLLTYVLIREQCFVNSYAFRLYRINSLEAQLNMKPKVFSRGVLSNGNIFFFPCLDDRTSFMRARDLS